MEIVANNILQLQNVKLKQCLGFGLPLAQGVCSEPEQLQLFQNSAKLAAMFQARNRWPDGSLRWVWCEALVEANGALDLALGEAGAATRPERCNSDNVASEFIKLVKSENAEVFASVALPGLPGELQLSATLTWEGASKPCELEQLSLDIRDSGFYQHASIHGRFPWQQSYLNFTYRMQYCAESGQWLCSVRLHNPEAASHPEGCWDLGDAGSAIIDQFRFAMHGPQGSWQAKIFDCASGKVHTAAADFVLEQTASGGEHWQSPIHINADKSLSVDSNGFVLQQGDERLVTGSRAQPQLSLGSENSLYQLELIDFWQNFPLQLGLEKSSANWGLFPQRTELQGGEAKTWHFHLAGGDNKAQASDCLQTQFSAQVIYNLDYLDHCACLPHLGLSQVPAEFDSLTQLGLEGAFPFEEKRERIDMYGWRNYGDLYADHEMHGLPEEPYFTSVYNNQYDPLMGMTLQYLRSGDKRWQSLSQALNRHVQDIDIYDTEKDKAEYNGGLFWHTNHYLKMETCTHRSYSKHHTAAYENFSAGGGPGGQHCYTTGLMLQYLLFGDKTAAQKVEQLCHWIRCFYNGTDSLLDRSFRFLTVDIKANGMSNIGVKAPGFRYPLDRGTGNFLVALMDCYEVTGREALLAEAAYVIRNTCHPKENLAQRNLLDVENAWFYTVFLQAVVRFTLLKHSLQQHDSDFQFARDSVMHYAAWMLDNEAFYLDRPEVLEFANDTWVAQDIRKATVYGFASLFASDATLSLRYAEAREETIQYIVNKLGDSQEQTYTRILVLLMQNVFTLRLPQNVPDSLKIASNQHLGKAPAHSKLRAFGAYVGDMFRLLAKFSLSREIAWFKLRFLKGS